MYKHIDTITDEKVQPIVFILEGGNIDIGELLKLYELVDILAQKNIGKIKCYVRFEVLDMSRYVDYGSFSVFVERAIGRYSFKAIEKYKFKGLVPVATPFSSEENNLFCVAKRGLSKSPYLYFYGGRGSRNSCIDLYKYRFQGLGSALFFNHDSMYDEEEKYFPKTFQTAFKNQFGNLPLLSQNEVGLSFVFVSDNPNKFKGIDELKGIVPNAKFYGFCKGGKENGALVAFTGDSNNVYDISQVDALANAILSNQLPKIKYVEPMSPSFDLPLLKDARYDNE